MYGISLSQTQKTAYETRKQVWSLRLLRGEDRGPRSVAYHADNYQIVLIKFHICGPSGCCGPKKTLIKNCMFGPFYMVRNAAKIASEND